MTPPLRPPAPPAPAALHGPDGLDEWKRHWKHILVYLECHDGAVHPASLQVLGKARELALEAGCEVHGIAIGEDREFLRALLAPYPLERVYLCQTKEAHFLTEAHCEPFIRCVRRLRPSVVLLAATPAGKAIAPRVATALGSGLTADCTGLGMRANTDLVQIRPAYGGDIMARIVTTRSRPQFATVRPDVMPPQAALADPGVEFVLEESETSLQTAVELLTTEPRRETHDITRSELLVVAGKGLRRQEDLVLLRELAELLGGELAATRGIVEQGWLPANRQIGLSGKNVTPELLIACGVSGSVQFLEGVRQTRTIIAIDSDPDARILAVAHYPILGDLYEIVPALIARLKTNGERPDGAP
jgi:electron transfer flavoprotein alpha subunit